MSTYSPTALLNLFVFFGHQGALRYFTYGDIPFNYGALPRTWEDPTVSHPDTSYPGDNDPVDVVEMSPEPIAMGEVTPVKVS